MINALASIGSTVRLPEFPMAAASAPARPAGGSDFGSLLASMANGAIDTLKQGEVAALQGMQGTMPVQQVVDQVLASERTLQAGLAIRDKLVTAFLDISRMQI